MFRKYTNNYVFMDEEKGGEQGGGGAEPQTTQGQSPNDDWKNDPKLDENGNPIEEKPQPEDTPENKTDEGVKDNVEEKETVDESIFNTPVVKQVESLLNDAGLNPSEVSKAVTENDGKLTPALLKALVDKHGDAVASLVADQLGKFHVAAQEKTSRRDKAVYDQVKEAFKDVTEQSGEDTWKELSGWAKENIPNNERKEINALLQQGGIAAKYAIDDLVNRFKSSDSFVQPAELEAGDNFSQDNSGLQPISQQEYNRKFRELESKGHVYGSSTELDKLDRQRMAGRKRGI